MLAERPIFVHIGDHVSDKVVIFGRIRENRRSSPDEPLQALFDRRIPATLTRTLFAALPTVGGG